MSVERLSPPGHLSGTQTPVVWAFRGHDRAVADFVAARICPDRSFSAAVAGGHTPRSILPELASRKLAWNRVRIIPTDERLVHECCDASNYGMLSRALDHTGATIERLGPGAGKLDLLWLGMAEDGKIASLFTAADASHDAADVVRTEPPVNSGHVAHPRLSLSVPAMAEAKEIILVIRGAAKRRLVERAVAGDMRLPLTHLLHRAERPVTVFWSVS